MNGLASFLFYNLKKKSELKVYEAKSIKMVKVTLFALIIHPYNQIQTYIQRIISMT